MWDVLTAETLWRGELRSAATKPSLQAIHVAAFMPLLFCLQAKPAANLPGSLLSQGLWSMLACVNVSGGYWFLPAAFVAEFMCPGFQQQRTVHVWLKLVWLLAVRLGVVFFCSVFGEPKLAWRGPLCCSLCHPCSLQDAARAFPAVNPSLSRQWNILGRAWGDLAWNSSCCTLCVLPLWVLSLSQSAALVQSDHKLEIQNIF